MSERLAIDGGPPVRERGTFLVFGAPSINQPEIDEVLASFASGWIGTGPKVHAFEAAFADYVGAKHAIAVSSCTAALHLSLLAAGVGPGDEVITTPMTFAATANVIEHVGATPVFVDVERGTMNIDPLLLEAAVTPRTRAIIPVDFAGRPVAMEEILALCERHDLTFVEDAAHCIEGVYQGRKIGAIADATCFSFYVTKNITTIEGGMVTTDSDEIATGVRQQALHGMSADAWSRFSDEGFKHYEVVSPGFKYNLTDVQASLGLHQLARIDSMLERREVLWKRYDEALADLPLMPLNSLEEGITHARHLYILLLDLDRLTATRDQILDAVQNEGIGCGVHYTALHLHDYYQRTYGFKPGDFPEADWISQRTMSIPLSPKLTDEDADDVIAAVRKVLQHYTK